MSIHSRPGASSLVKEGQHQGVPRGIPGSMVLKEALSSRWPALCLHNLENEGLLKFYTRVPLLPHSSLDPGSMSVRSASQDRCFQIGLHTEII